ncbi:hypothetical protein GZ77_12290 [Endozoicomonas montiporae]|uniref:Uncharacterized protein n=2 Tax=Endozoicomonas montiporae TaxID=1027273 RepID=A0A081N445_9GAMM|nr:IS91 family transposase [Endozoicomonas montiporae CL-33]KEQ13218.1 hypothetical protein GZ77_12290 [Endozoicomonas montiporae]
MTVITEQFSKLRRHGEGDVLPLGIRKNGFLLLYPLVRELLAAGRAEPAFATETDFLLMGTALVAALKHGIATNGQSAAEHFDDVIDDGSAYAVFMLLIKTPPQAILMEQFFKAGWQAHCRRQNCCCLAL